MNIQSKSGPVILNPSTAKAADARSRAIAKLTETIIPQQSASQVQDTPVKNASSIQPEEMTAIKPPTSQKTISEPQENVVEETKTQSTSDQLSPQYAMLAKKERALRLKSQEIKSKEDAFKAKEEEYQSKYIQKDRLTSDPLSVLNELGVSYEQLTSLILSQGTPEQAAQNSSVQKLEAEIRAIREAQDADRKAIADQQSKAYQNALSQIRNEARSLVDSDPDFEVTRETKSVGQIVELIERTYNEDGVLLSVEEAARQVEDYLVERHEKFARLNKIQSRIKPVAPKQAPAEEKQTQQGTQTQSQSKTLTNTMATTPRLSSKERAIMAFKGQLNKS